MSKNSIYSEIYSDLLEQLQSPIYKVGDEIPSASKLAEKYAVSRPTVHKALKQLQNEGLIESKVGSGTVLIKKPASPSDTPLFGLIFPLLRMEGFFGNMARCIAELSNEFNFKLIWGGEFPQGSIDLASLDQMSEFYIQQGVDGVFMTPVELTDDCYETNKVIIDKLERAGIPVIVIDSGVMSYPDNIRNDIVSIDNFRAGYILADYMLKNGSSRIDFCTLPNVGRAVLLRRKGIESALLDHGICPRRDWFHILTEEDELAAYLKKNGASNIICSNDFVAVRLQRILQRQDYRIPEDFRIAGFDGSDLALETHPSITTIVQPCEDMAYLAVEAMMSRMANPSMPVRQIMTNFDLRIGKST